MGSDWQLEWLGRAFADPWFLCLLAPVLGLWLWRRRRPGPALGHAGVAALRALPRTARVRLAGLPGGLSALGLAALCLALARPQTGGRVPIRSEGIDIFLCLDLSGSMHIPDMDLERGRSRIEVAKELAEEFAEARVADRVGLVGFALFPELICPRTLDKQALIRFLRPLEAKPRTSPENKTGIGRGLAECVHHLEDGDARSRVVILLSDGQETVGDVMPADAAKLAKDAGIRVYTIGIGKGEPSPLGSFLRPLEFPELETVAEVTGGAFFEAADAGTLAKVFARIDELERAPLEDPLYVFDEDFFPFLAAGLALLAAALLLRHLWLGELP